MMPPWLGITLWVGAGLQAPSATGLVARADSAVQALRGLKAEFRQEVRNPRLEKIQRGHGLLYFRPPHWLRLEFQEPRGDLIVADKTSVWLYLPSQAPGQVLRSPGDRERPWLSPYHIVEVLRERYRPSLMGGTVVSRVPCYHLRFTPLEEVPYLTEVDLWVEKRSGLPRRARWKDFNGVETTYEMARVEINPPLPPSLFTFEPPPGVEVFDTPGRSQ